MARQAITTTHRDIIKQIRERSYAPVYLLMGDESYYIDRISEYIAENVLTASEQDFNQHIIYCTRETHVADIINLARRYPMMSDYQVVIVKEAQNLQKIEELAIYAKQPLDTTILVICYKNGSIDRRKKLVSAIEETGIVFESKKLREGMLPSFIQDYLKRKNISIDQQSTMMLVEYIGSDLNRIASELDKLINALPQGANSVNAAIIEKNIGISKEFNNWELRTAIVNKDIYKANQIISFFEANPKTNQPKMTISMLFNLFSSIMLAYYAPNKSQEGLMEQLDLKAEWQLKEYSQALRLYSAVKTMQIIRKIRETDGKLKGIRKGNMTDGEIMQELIHFILH